MLRIFSCRARAAPSAACLALAPLPLCFRPCGCPLAPVSVPLAFPAVRPSARLLVPRSAPPRAPGCWPPSCLAPRLLAGSLPLFVPPACLPCCAPVCRPPVLSCPPARPPALRCWLILDPRLPCLLRILSLFIAIRVCRCCCFLSALCAPLAELWFGCVCVAPPPGFRFGRGGFLICCSGDAFLPDTTLKITSSEASPSWEDPHACAHSHRYILLH